MLQMPMCEVFDKYTIALLKCERIDDPAERAGLDAQLRYYAAAAEPLLASRPGLRPLVEKLRQINGRMWDAEAAIRAADEHHLGLEEVGRRALVIRDLNRTRVAVKNQISDHFHEVFRDVKVNYAGGDEGQ